eukprot:750621-Hanusia_phi.AAC.2
MARVGRGGGGEDCKVKRAPGLDSRLDELQSRINRVEKEQEDVRSEICTLRAQVGELSKKLQGVQPTEQ